MNQRLASVMQWVGINGEELIAQSKRREAEAYVRYRDGRFSRDPEYRKLIQWRQRFNSVLFGRMKRDAASRRKTHTCRKLCGFDLEEVVARIESRFYKSEDGKVMTWENHGKTRNHWVIDHIKPVCLFDWWTHEGRREAWHPDNLQPLWYLDHMKKCVEDRVLARLRRREDPSYAQRVQKWRVLPDDLPDYETVIT